MSDSAVSLSQSELRERTVLWLLLILLLAVALRFLGLDLQSYWYDELFSAHISKPSHSFGEVVAMTLDDVHPPGFQLSMWLSYKFFGYTEWAGRLPSAIAGTLTVLVIYLLGRELFNQRAAHYAALLAAVNYYLVYFSQEARSYAFLTLLSGLAFLFFLRALRSASWLNVVGFVVASLALVYSHYFGFLTLLTAALSLGIYAWLTGGLARDVLTRAAIAGAIIVLGVLPLVPAIAGHASIDSFWIPQPGPAFFVYYFIGYFFSVSLAACFAAAMAYGIYQGSRADSWHKFAVCALLVWIVVGYLVPWLRGFIAQPVATDRNTIYLLLPVLLLTGFGLARISLRPLQAFAAVGLAGASIWVLVAEAGYYTDIKKHQYRQMAAALSAFEPVLPVYTLKWNDTKYNVYFEQQNSQLRAVDIVELEEELAAGMAPPIFWLADGHLRPFQTETPERYSLRELGRMKFKGTFARLYANPAGATPLTLADTDGGYATAPLPAFGRAAYMYIAPAMNDRADFEGAIVTEVRSPAGLFASAVQVYEGMPLVMRLPEIQSDSIIRVELPKGAAAPEVWLIPAVGGGALQ